MTKLYFVDFDRTLFNHREFFQDLCTVLASDFGIDGEVLHKISHTHDVVRSRASGIFDVFAQVRETYPDVDVGQIKASARDKLMGRAYTFADVRQFVDHLSRGGHKMKIITVGTDEYQRFKFEFTPELGIFEFIPTQKPKSECLKNLGIDFSQYEQVVLVDDRADTFDEGFAELGMRGIRLNRVGSQYGDTPTPQGIEEVSNLLEIEV